MSDRKRAFEHFLAHIEDAGLCQIAAYWHAARGDRRMPAWRDIDALAIRQFLPIVWSWRFDRDTETFSGRLSGEAISDAFGRSLRGVPMQDFFLGEGYPPVYVRHHKVVTDPCFSRDHGAVFRHVDRAGTGERIIMPLADDGEHSDGILGATADDLAQLGSGTRARPSFDNLEYFPL